MPRPAKLNRRLPLVWLVLAAASAAPAPCLAAEPAGALRPVITTNYVVVTNIVLVTNYVAGATVMPVPDHAGSGPGNSAMTDLGWGPPEDEFDWIQLKTGEWLKGRIKALQDQELEFDSEKLNDLSFDWKDIRQVRSPRSLDVLFVDGAELTGPVTITPDAVTVGGTTPRVEPRDRLQSLTPGGTRERNHWSGLVSVGLTLRAGNSQQFEYNGQAHLQRRTPASRLGFDYIGNASRVNGVESANNHRVNAEFDYWLSRRFYLVLPAAEYYRDPFQNLAHRLTTGVGVGYDLIARPRLEWNITTGPAYQQAWFESSQPGQPDRKSAAALWFGSRFDWNITRRVELIAEYRGQFTSREVGETTHHGVTTVSLDLTERFDLDVSFVWDRISQPKVGLDGMEPKRDDFRLILGVGLDF